MGRIKYAHSSMYGTFEVDCEILGRNDNGDFLIRYISPLSGEIERRMVSGDELTFPDFSEYHIP